MEEKPEATHSLKKNKKYIGSLVENLSLLKVFIFRGLAFVSGCSNTW
jgi:hypothetical protein